MGRQVDELGGRFKNFWRRVTDGLALQQLWGQFKTEARNSYGLYAKEVDWESLPGESRWKRCWRITRAFFWAMAMKLSPARRVLLVVALTLLILGIFDFEVTAGNGRYVVNLGGGHGTLAGLALLVLLALELADRVIMKRDLEIAREIQQWLVPEVPPAIPGVDIAFASRAANTVAGDYYDAFLRPSSTAAQGPPTGANAGQATETGADSRRLMLAVADVAGKSVPAALLMATFQASLRTLALEPGSLLDLVSGLNAYACQHSLQGRRFTTAFLAELDLATRTLAYVNAGHNQPMLLKAAGRIERLSQGGIPLGIVAAARYECGTATLEPGDRLVIFTDGVVEAENEAGDQFGETRLLASLQSEGGKRAGAALEALMSSIDAFVANAPQHDDITSMILDGR